MEIIKKGAKAPEFALQDQFGEVIRLSDLKGKRVLLSYHPLAWTPVCTDQMRTLEREFERIREKGVDVVIGVSVDGTTVQSRLGKISRAGKCPRCRRF